MEDRWRDRPAGDDHPDLLKGAAWQRVDDDHPAGAGRSCYHVLFKTLRVAVQDAELRWPNLVVRFGSGEVEKGGFRVHGAIQTRIPQHLVLPEFGAWESHADGTITYEPLSRVDPSLQGWQETTPPLFYVEILLDTDSDEPSEILPEGRRKTSSIVTMLDLTLGRRLLGAVVAEEAGERFEDGHFNRRIGTDVFAWEAQLNVKALSQRTIVDWAQSVVDPWMSRSEDHQRKVSLAAQWYQSAISSQEPVLSFLQHWFAVEVLTMEGRTNIAAVRDLLPAAVSEEVDFWREVTGRLYGLRGDLVHGRVATVDEAQLAAARCLAEYCFANYWQANTTGRLDELREAGQRLLDQLSR